jgi:hypothetical protein
VAPSPGAITGPAFGVCDVNTQYSVAGDPAVVNYEWIVPAGVTITSPSNTQSSINVSIGNAGDGFVNGSVITVIAHYACADSQSQLAIDGKPGAPSITPAIICSGVLESYTANVSTGANNYNWTASGADYNDCDINDMIVCATYDAYWSVAGPHSLSVSATNNCGTGATTTINSSGNCNRIAMDDNFNTNVYPNPTTGIVTVEFSSSNGGNHHLSVTDLSGRMVLNTEVAATRGMNRFEMDLGFANAGIYMLYVKDQNGKISVTKVAVEQPSKLLKFKRPSHSFEAAFFILWR